MVDAFEPGDHIIRRRFGVLELGKGDGCCAQSWGSRGGRFLATAENRSDFSRFSMVVCIEQKILRLDDVSPIVFGHCRRDFFHFFEYTDTHG